MIGPEFERLSRAPEWKDILFVQIDMDQQKELAARCNVTVRPTFISFQDGKGLSGFSRADPTALRQMLAQLRPVGAKL